ncbi:MAG: late promoter transcription accessory protein, partial [Flammeovirgaceae bacterium]
MFIELTKEDFSKKVENRVKEKECSYMDAIIYILEENSIDITVSP